MDKSSIHFSKGCASNLKDEIKEILRMQNEALSAKYLGMPTDVGSSSNGAFKYLKDHVWAKVQGWMEKTLLAGGGGGGGSAHQGSRRSNSNIFNIMLQTPVWTV
ncbi:hypothetical protein PR202_gb07657 [Eleusine coracana subsp. coracana]|uniref:Uncharacterized protein n=1 Tax=Eleusine coracana subsp. coracana TaxID=191504 RepID=A0AAV5EBY2_ELECO|nr:hypothetical protein PR202_gb07657 [Eleusine coracana subsp. coracana]